MRRRQLNRPGGHRADRVRATGGRLLIVPKADRAAGGVSVKADRMRVDRRLQPPGDRRRPRRDEHVVAGRPGTEGTRHRVLHGVRCRQPVTQPLWRVTLARAQHVSEVLRIGVEPQIGNPEIHPQHVARPDHLAPAKLPCALPEDRDRRLEPRGELQPGDPFAVPPDEVVGGGRPRRDSACGEALRDDRMRDAHDLGIPRDLGWGACFQPADRQIAGRHDALCMIADRPAQFIILAGGQPIGEGAFRRYIHGDPTRAPLGDDLPQPLPLVGLLLRLPRGREQAGKAIAAHRQPLDRAPRAGIVEHQDRAPPRMKALGIEHRGEHRILGIFARDEDPHVDTRLAHQPRHQRVEPLAQPGVADLGLLTQRQHRGRERRQCLRLIERGHRRCTQQSRRRHDRHHPHYSPLPRFRRAPA